MKFTTQIAPQGVKVGSLSYGTLLMYGNSMYIKVDKRNVGMGVSLHFSKGNCVLFNPKLGTLREISGSTPVQILDTIEDEILVRIITGAEQDKYMKTCSK